MRALAALVTGRRGKWVTVALWIVLAVIFAPLGSKLADKGDNRTERFLPKDAESTKVVKQLEDDFPGGQTVTGLIVYHHPGGLTAADKAKMVSDAKAAQANLPLIGKPVVPFQPGTPKELVAPQGDLAYSIVALPDNQDKLGDWGKELRTFTSRRAPPGTGVLVTGNLGFNADFKEVFSSLDTKLLLATVLLVLVLLGAIYRAPVIAVVPLLVVGFAYSVAQGLIYLYADSGATVSTNSTQILVVLLFGVGTDYCLLLV